MITILNEDDLIEGTEIDDKTIHCKQRFYGAILNSDMVIVLGKDKLRVIKDRHKNHLATYDIDELQSLIQTKPLNAYHVELIREGVEKPTKKGEITPKRLDLVEQEVQQLMGVLHQRNEDYKKLHKDVEDLSKQVSKEEDYRQALEDRVEVLEATRRGTTADRVKKLLDSIVEGSEW